MNSTAVRLGGLCGIGAAATAIPAYVIESPELPDTPDKLAGYYAQAESFIAANGLIPLAHLFLGIVFIAVLVAVLRAAMGPEPAVCMALLGGAVFIALTAAGLAAGVLGLLALVHTWVGVPAAYGTVAWVAIMGLVLPAFPPSQPVPAAGVGSQARRESRRRADGRGESDSRVGHAECSDGAGGGALVLMAQAETVEVALPTETTEAVSKSDAPDKEGQAE